MNNKFGDCCNCPALIDGRYFTRYDDRINLNLELMKKNNITDSLVLRKYLIENGSNLINSNISNIETNYKCNYNKPADQPSSSISSGYYISGSLSDPAETLAPFDSLSNNLTENSPVVNNNESEPRAFADKIQPLKQ
jgi:hypothetical protein